jgi:thiamine monophosphate kinase
MLSLPLLVSPPTKEILYCLASALRPQVALAQSLLGIANSCIDISDGLEQDLSHILTCSKVGAGINLEALPLSSEVAQHIANTQDWCVALAGGDDYELCFTAPNAYINRIKAIAANATHQSWVLAICCATSLDSGNASKLIPAPTFEQVKICDKSCSSILNSPRLVRLLKRKD